MRENLIHELRTMAKFYNISYPATAKLLREAACELEEAARIMEITTGDAATDIEKKLLSATWLNKPTKTN
jgi:hypothetical protein